MRIHKLSNFTKTDIVETSVQECKHIFKTIMVGRVGPVCVECAEKLLSKLIEFYEDENVRKRR